MENQDFSKDVDFEDGVKSELSDIWSTEDLISQEHWNISSDEFETDFGTVDEHQTV